MPNSRAAGPINPAEIVSLTIRTRAAIDPKELEAKREQRRAAKDAKRAAEKAAKQARAAGDDEPRANGSSDMKAKPSEDISELKNEIEEMRRQLAELSQRK